MVKRRGLSCKICACGMLPWAISQYVLAKRAAGQKGPNLGVLALTQPLAGYGLSN